MASSFKLMGRINNLGGTYVTVSLGRTDQVSLKTARAEAQAIHLKLARGEDPRRVKLEVPTVIKSLNRFLPIPSRLITFPPRRSAFFMARSVLRDIRSGAWTC